MKNIEQEVARYMELPYRIELIPDPHGWFVRMPELPGCMSQGDTQEEALTMIREAQRLWLRTALEDGWTIPEPRSDEDYSGKFNVRVPRSVHRDLVRAAEEEGVSLNLFVATALARSTGRPGTADSAGAYESVAANGSHRHGDVMPHGILERLGSLHKRLAGVSSVLEDVPIGPKRTEYMAQLILEYKSIRTDAEALVRDGLIEWEWIKAPLETVQQKVGILQE